MNNPDRGRLVLPTLITIVVIRMFIVATAKTTSLQFIFYDQMYHLYYGLGILIMAIAVRFWTHATALFGIGAGVFLDDLGALKYILGGVPEDPTIEYWSPLFILPMLAGLLVLSLGENKIKRMFSSTGPLEKEV